MAHRPTATFLAVLALSSCTITTDVKPVPVGTRIPDLCIERNSAVMLDEFLPELQFQILTHGVRNKPYSGPLPSGCRYHLKYSASWDYDGRVTNITFMRLQLFDGQREIGNAVYDARHGTARVDKFGSTREKLLPLTAGLFNKPAKYSD
jgi:hypothetical protein